MENNAEDHTAETGTAEALAGILATQIVEGRKAVEANRDIVDQHLYTFGARPRIYTPFGDSIAKTKPQAIRLGVFLCFWWAGREPIPMQLSTGQLRQPVQKLVATII